MIKYAKLNQSTGATLLNSNDAYSPVNSAVILKRTPAVTICQAVLTITCRSSFSCASDFLKYLDANEPTVQAMEPNTKIHSAMIFKFPLALSLEAMICSANNITTPMNPSTTPATVVTLLKFSFHLGLSSKINQIAAAAAIIAATPPETYCSAQMTPAISTNRSKKPTKAASNMERLLNSL
ncbi:hypothetical protein D3C86_1481010 [compost metagenome]